MAPTAGIWEQQWESGSTDTGVTSVTNDDRPQCDPSLWLPSPTHCIRAASGEKDSEANAEPAPGRAHGRLRQERGQLPWWWLPDFTHSQSANNSSPLASPTIMFPPSKWTDTTHLLKVVHISLKYLHTSFFGSKGPDIPDTHYKANPSQSIHKHNYKPSASMSVTNTVSWLRRSNMAQYSLLKLFLTSSSFFFWRQDFSV